MKSESQELPPDVYDFVKARCAKGDELAVERKFDEAIAEYNKAWLAVPEPKNDWNASTWILAAIADSFFQAGYLTSARKALAYAMTCPGALGNPFLHLRYGQALFDIGELEAAADELVRAYMGGGAELFALEDARYLDFLTKRALI